MKIVKTELRRAVYACRGGLYATAIFSLFVNLLLFVSPLYMLQVYDRVLASRSEGTLVALTLIALVMLGVMAALDGVRSRVMIRVGVMFENALRNRVFGAVFRRTLDQPGGAHHQSLRDLETLRAFGAGPAFLVFCDAPWVPLFLGVCFMLHPMLGTVSLIGALVIFGLAAVNEFATRRQHEDASRESMAAGHYAETSLRNAEVISAMGLLPGLLRRWQRRHERGLHAQSLAADRSGALLATSKAVRQFLQIAILGTGAWLAINGDITPGAIIAASIIMGRALAPVEMAVGQWKGFVSARMAWKRLEDLLSSTEDMREPMKLPVPEGHLSVERALAVPPGAKSPVVRDISFELEPGDVLGVVGPSAAGKSTLARLLVGVWPNLAGSIRLDGNEIGNWNRDQLGQYIGYLPQDVELFDGSVADNIARFNEIEADKVVQAAMQAGVHEMILRLPEGYDTPIGAFGQALSGGQRQRIGLARALYGDPALVVLDEPNSNLDTAGEQALIGAVNSLRKRKATAVVVTHRLSILGAVNKILVMRDGQVEMFGDRDEVLQRLSRPQVVASQDGAAVAARRQNGSTSPAKVGS
ncbi:type I secretion system permease/ATPase [Telmatospirillum sp. J64-1]|uniref:type I secretion system permease/ATPase n=1 Tax=Telmatospirillum sp. J64-1 TaxID=2502183 RepID=UPI00163D574A|nr:type I secretion system permease/ATPase [Telmatospirillum sp. J64-1]